MFATIQPVPAFPQPAVALYIANVTVYPANSAAFVWTLEDAERNVVGRGSITLEGDAYAAWGSDDAYLYTYTAAQLGLTIVEIVPDAPAVVEPPPPVITAPPVLPDGAPLPPADPVPAPSND